MARKTKKILNHKFKIIKGDKVIVICGRDKGKSGQVKKVLPKLGKVIVEGVNIYNKTLKPTIANPKKERMAVEFPIDISNIAYLDSKTNKATRVGFKINTEGKKVRFAKRSGETIG